MGRYKYSSFGTHIRVQMILHFLFVVRIQCTILLKRTQVLSGLHKIEVESEIIISLVADLEMSYYVHINTCFKPLHTIFFCIKTKKQVNNLKKHRSKIKRDQFVLLIYCILIEFKIYKLFKISIKLMQCLKFLNVINF